MKIILVKQLNNTLKCAYNSDYEKLKKLKSGEEYECDIKKPRNYKFHRKFFALIKLVFENQERYQDMERLRKDLIIESGFYKEWVDLHGAICREAKSISFSSMKETEFEQLYDKVLDVIVKYFKFEKEEILQNLEEFY